MIRLTKTDLRERIRAKRVRLTPAWCATQSALVQQRLLRMPELDAAAVVGVYIALRDEVELADLMAALIGRGQSLCVPCFDRERRRYAMAAVDQSTRYRDAAFGLREPESPVWVDPLSLECVVVPGVAFDVACHRVGHGGGHYDRMLSGIGATRVGVAYDFQVFDEVPVEAHDLAMDRVVTPTRNLGSV